MNRTMRIAILLFVTITLGFMITCRIFDTTFAETSIDWLSFAAGTFLIVEGIYKILRSRKDPFYLQLFRGIRVLGGAEIFIIHLIQFNWGVDAEILNTPFRQSMIDWSTFLIGIFLVTEGTCRIFTSKASIMRDQTLRMIRVFIGSCIFTIHLLQFTRFGL